MFAWVQIINVRVIIRYLFFVQWIINVLILVIIDIIYILYHRNALGFERVEFSECLFIYTLGFFIGCNCYLSIVIVTTE